VRFITSSQDQGARLGLLASDLVIDLNAVDPEIPATMRAFLTVGPTALERAANVLRHWVDGQLAAEVVHAMADLRLLTPNPDPPKVVAVGVNYLDRCREVTPHQPMPHPGNRDRRR
jgi:acylpyruvate hydrolase